MPPNEPLRALCVSVHDVAPHTWPLCQRLLQAIDEVAPIPVTLLVVPAYHRLPVRDGMAYRWALEARRVRGDELALHGYTHLDDGPPPRGWGERFKRHVYTLREGEFSALDTRAARQRLERGLAWFAGYDWPVEGFVAPAWLIGEGTWQALRAFPFTYTSTLQRFYLLPERESLLSPSLVYAARNAWGRTLSCGMNTMLSHALAGQPLIRLGLHPADARFPRLVKHYQALLETLLATRQPMTKAAFARQWTRPASTSQSGRNRSD